MRLGPEYSVEQTIPFLKQSPSARVIPVAMPVQRPALDVQPVARPPHAPPTSALVVAQPRIVTQSAKWKQYHDIGLVPPAHAEAAPAHAQSTASKAAAKLVVSGYRALGLTILTIIVIVLVGYISSTLFYYLSRSWVTPTIISPSDDKVVAAKNELSSAQNTRDKTAADLHDAQRAIAVEQTFQLEFTKAVADDLAGRKEQLDRVRSLAGAAASTRAHIRGAADAYAKSFTAKNSADYASGLIDRDKMASSNFQAAQMSSSSLDLAEKQVELEGQARDLARETAALDTLLAQQGGDKSLSYDVLKIKRDYEASKLALAKAIETRDTLAASLARQDDIIAGLKQSAYLRALDDKATVALVPYNNLDHATAGAALYACRIGMVWCHQVGEVVAVLPGEVPVRNPHDESTLRGQMIEMHLDDADAARDQVLFADGKPLGI
nr:hypothetical protein [Kofleriaceae bacterium]